MNFTDEMLEKLYGKKVIAECELETLRLDNARLQEENENLKAQFRADTKRIQQLTLQIEEYIEIVVKNENTKTKNFSNTD